MGPEHDGPVRPRALALPDRDAAEDHLARRDPDSPDLGWNVPFYGLDHFAVRQVTPVSRALRVLEELCSSFKCHSWPFYSHTCVFTSPGIELRMVGQNATALPIVAPAHLAFSFLIVSATCL